MYPKDIHNKRILIASLNWGLGHVARCIPIIKDLKSRNNQVWIACSDIQKDVFSSYFNDVNYISLSDFPFKFKGGGHFTLDILLQSPILFKKFKREKRFVNNLLNNLTIDLIISDQRYSFRSKRCASIFITHQLHLPNFFLKYFFQKVHLKNLSKFKHIWICDTKESEFAGDLSRNKNLSNCFFIGPQSRFNNADPNRYKDIDHTLIISGPKAYHYTLIQYFLSKVDENQVNCVISPCNIDADLVDKLNSLNISQITISRNWEESDSSILRSKKITSFCGYTTLMDLHFLNIDSDLIATPGQNEQKYLYKFHNLDSA